MGTTQLTYSKAWGWIGLVVFICVASLLVFEFYILSGNFEWTNPRWLVAVAVICILSGTYLYFFKKLIIPSLFGKVALQLDEEKLHSYVTNQTIYWQDVVEITEDYWHGHILVFELIDGDKLKVPTRWITGRSSYIDDTVQKYFAHALQINP